MPEDQDELARTLRTLRFATMGLFLIALTALIYFARDFLLPVVLAFLLALTLSPIVRYLQKRGVAPAFTALVLVLLIVGVFSASAYLLADPVSEWIEREPQIGQRVQQKLAALRRPVEAVVKASEQVETIAEGTSFPAVQKVVVQQPGLLSIAANNAVSALSTAGVTFVLTAIHHWETMGCSLDTAIVPMDVPATSMHFRPMTIAAPETDDMTTAFVVYSPMCDTIHEFVVTTNDMEARTANCKAEGQPPLLANAFAISRIRGFQIPIGARSGGVSHLELINLTSAFGQSRHFAARVGGSLGYRTHRLP
jgi:hypothetical protein